MSKNSILALAGLSVGGLVLLGFTRKGKWTVGRTAKQIREDVTEVGAYASDGLNHLAAAVQDARKIMQIVSRRVDNGLHQIA